jgi:hypothetical protein
VHRIAVLSFVVQSAPEPGIDYARRLRLPRLLTSSQVPQKPTYLEVGVKDEVVVRVNMSAAPTAAVASLVRR